MWKIKPAGNTDVKELPSFVACVVSQTDSTLNRCCRDENETSTWDHVQQYPVEEQMSVAVCDCEACQTFSPQNTRTKQRPGSLRQRTGNRKSAQSDVDPPTGEVAWGWGVGVWPITPLPTVGLASKQKKTANWKWESYYSPYSPPSPNAASSHRKACWGSVSASITGPKDFFLTNCVYKQKNPKLNVTTRSLANTER